MSSNADTIPPTVFHLVSRQQSQPPSCVFQKLPKPCLPSYEPKRSPPYHFIQRLKDFPPNLQDLIIVASTISADVGMFTRSQVALTHGFPTEKVTGVFTTTTMAVDSRRAQLPMTEDLSDTSPIGVALDLSSKENVSRPLPGEEMDASSIPLPAVLILNNEGVLSSWWIVYVESIRHGTTYPGLVVASGDQPQAQSLAGRQASPFGGMISQTAPTSSPNPFGVPNAFGKPSTPSSGTVDTPGPAPGPFGASSALGKPQSPWTTSGPASAASGSGTSAVGKPAFGTQSSLGGTGGPAFGATGAIGNRASPWGAPPSGSSAASGSVFGKPGGLVMATSGANPFGPKVQSGTSAPTSTGGFASFANAPGFMGAQAQSSGESPFVKASTGTSFGSNMETDSSFGGTPKKTDEAPGSLFPSTGFTLGSTFEGDGTARDDEPKPANDASNSFFGNNFSNTLGEAQKAVSTPVTREADMEDSADENDKTSRASTAEQESSTPAAQPKSRIPNTTPPLSGGFFGTQSQSKTTPAAVQSSNPATTSWGNPTPTMITPKDTPTSALLWDKPTPISTTPKETPRKPVEIPSSSIKPSSSRAIKPEPEEEGSSGIDRNIPEPPLPPESTSKVSFAAGESSNSSASTSKAGADDAPLPPDFMLSKGKAQAPGIPPLEQPSLPSDTKDGSLDEGLDDEGSGVDVALELSPTTAGSSFGGSFDKSSFDKSPLGGVFTKVKPHQPRPDSKSLFGEIGQTSVPHFPPPSKVQESPRSPSPVRQFLQGDSLRAPNARSVSAPGHPAEGASQKKSVPRKTVPVSGLRVSAEDDYRESLNRASAERAKRVAEEEQSLSDREDEKVREELETEVQGTKILDEFLAHQDYVGNIDKPGVPGQIEKVYRDINSMIDTLGLNARSLNAFVKGHTEMYKQGGHSIEDLEDEDDWCLIELGDLESIEGSLLDRLGQCRIGDFQERVGTCRELRKELKKVETKGKEISKLIEAKSDPEHTAAVRLGSLSLEQVTVQHDLRKEFTRIQKLLAEVEGGITMLKTTLAAQDSRNGKSGAVKKPTVEAVTNTILKMTRMAEKKSGDIDVLETQMRKFHMSTANDIDLAESLSSMRISQGPEKKKAAARSLQRSLIRTPDRSNALLRESINGDGTPKRGLSGVTAEEVRRYRNKVQQRQAVNRILKEVFLEKGPLVRELESCLKSNVG